MQVLTLTADSQVVADLARLAKEQGAGASEPEPLNAGAAFNAGMTPEEMRQALEVITLFFKAGAAMFGFLTAARAYLRGRNSPAVVAVRDSDGVTRGRLSAATTDDDLHSIAELAGAAGPGT